MTVDASGIQLTMNYATGEASPKAKRKRSPTPRFRPDTTRQLNAVSGCPSLQVPRDHLARRILLAVENLDTSMLEAAYSSLGTYGYHPRRLLAVWLYASAIRLHHGSQVARAMRTDAAFLLLSGGAAVSAETLNRFRRRFAEYYPSLTEQLLKLAVERGLVKPDDLALDSVRLEADASMKQVRTLERSENRLEEMDKVDVEKLDEEQRAGFEAKRKKHEEAVAACRAQGRTNLVLSCPSASLLHLPHGAARPGHRVSAVVSGARSRFVVALLIDAASCDYGKVEPLMEATRRALTAAGIAEDARLQAAADAGYFSAIDLAYAARERGRVDVLINEPAAPLPKKPGHAKELKYFGREAFTVDLDAMTAVCPAKKPMEGPHKDQDGITKWLGVGCGDCPLKEQCTTAKRRKLTVRVEYERDRAEMRDRMAQPGARGRYNQRIGTVEPAFSYLEDVMGFRRVSSRKTETIESEIKLKVFAYNLLRLLFCVPSFLILLEVTESADEVVIRFWEPLEA